MLTFFNPIAVLGKKFNLDLFVQNFKNALENGKPADNAALLADKRNRALFVFRNYSVGADIAACYVLFERKPYIFVGIQVHFNSPLPSAIAASSKFLYSLSSAFGSE